MKKLKLYLSFSMLISELHQWKDLQKLCKVCQMKQDGFGLISVTLAVNKVFIVLFPLPN